MVLSLSRSLQFFPKTAFTPLTHHTNDSLQTRAAGSVEFWNVGGLRATPRDTPKDHQTQTGAAVGVLFLARSPAGPDQLHVLQSQAGPLRPTRADPTDPTDPTNQELGYSFAGHLAHPAELSFLRALTGTSGERSPLRKGRH